MATARQRIINKVNAKKTTATTPTGTPAKTTTLSASAMSNLQKNLKNTKTTKPIGNTTLSPKAMSNLNKNLSGGSNIAPKDTIGTVNTANNDATNVGGAGTGGTTGTGTSADTGGGVTDFLNPENLQKLQTLYPQLYQQGEFNYDPSQDAGLNVAQTQAMNRVTQDMVKRGRLYSSFTDTQQQQKAQELIPAFQQRAFEQFKYGEGQKRNKYLDEFSRMQNVLGLSKGIQDEKYQRSQDVQAQGNAMQKQALAEEKQFMQTQKDLADIAYKKAQTGEVLTNIEQKAFDLRKEEFQSAMPGVVMNQENMQYLDSYQKLMNNPDVAPFLKEINSNQESVDLGTVIGDLRAEGQDEVADAVGYLRYKKIMNNPELLEKYGEEYGMSSIDSLETAQKIQNDKLDETKKELDNYMKTIEAEYAQPLASIGLDKAVSDLNKGKYEEYIKGVQASYIDEEKKNDLIVKGMQIQNIQSQINDRSARLSLDKNADRRAEAKAKSGTDLNVEPLKGILKDYREELTDEEKRNFLSPTKSGSKERREAFDRLRREAEAMYDDGTEEGEIKAINAVRKVFNFSDKEWVNWNQEIQQEQGEQPYKLNRG